MGLWTTYLTSTLTSSIRKSLTSCNRQLSFHFLVMLSHFSWEKKNTLCIQLHIAILLLILVCPLPSVVVGFVLLRCSILSHTGVVKMMCESWISKKSSISVSPVSSLQLSPRGPNFFFQLSKHWLQRALIGATGKNKWRIFLQDSSVLQKYHKSIIESKIKTLWKWHAKKVCCSSLTLSCISLGVGFLNFDIWADGI